MFEKTGPPTIAKLIIIFAKNGGNPTLIIRCESQLTLPNHHMAWIETFTDFVSWTVAVRDIEYTWPIQVRNRNKEQPCQNDCHKIEFILTIVYDYMSNLHFKSIRQHGTRPPVASPSTWSCSSILSLAETCFHRHQCTGFHTPVEELGPGNSSQML